MIRVSILSLAILSELFLILLAYGMAWVSGFTLIWNPSYSSLMIGVVAAIPLLVGNHLLWNWTQHNPTSVYARFSTEIIVPLCKRVPPSHALLIGILSGIGEEALFRGALNQLVISWGGALAALVLTSLAFAWVHFVGVTKRFGGMIPLYTGVGAVLWLVWYLTDSLAAAAATHGVYNFCAIVWIRKMARQEDALSAR